MHAHLKKLAWLVLNWAPRQRKLTKENVWAFTRDFIKSPQYFLLFLPLQNDAFQNTCYNMWICNMFFKGIVFYTHYMSPANVKLHEVWFS